MYRVWRDVLVSDKGRFEAKIEACLGPACTAPLQRDVKTTNPLP